MNTLSFLKSDIIACNTIDPALYDKFEVKRGLRNKDGSGVLAGLTRVCSVIGFHKVENELIPVDGDLKYRGISIQVLVDKLLETKRCYFEQACFLLLLGRLPNKDELSVLCSFISQNRQIPQALIDHVLKGIPGKNVMNKLQGAVAALYGYDEDPENIAAFDDFERSIKLLAKMPLLIAYAYLASVKPDARFLAPKPEMSIAESFLYVLNEGKEGSLSDVEMVDLCLVLHAEHGGGNNSTFAARVISSSASDLYSTIVAAIASLKGPLHGSANKKVMDMMADIKASVKHWDDEAEVIAYLEKIVKQEAHDRTGKIYGLGHAVYTKSDPRAVIIRSYAQALSKDKGREKEMKLYELIAKKGPEVFQSHKGSSKLIAPNVDFFSGFVYDCLGLPEELYTPMFAISRTAGWCAHRIEEVACGKRIIRPAYKFVD